MIPIAVVGGGITGLAAAWELVGGGADVTVFEAGDRLGGRILTEDVGGRPVDLGPDAVLARVPDAVELCAELGLDGDLVHPAADGASVWTGGRLRTLPRGLVLGAPTGPGDLAALLRAGLLQPAGAARAALDLVLPATRWEPDPTVGRLIRTRLGREVHEQVVDPLVGGIHAGSSDDLSARAAAPQLAAAIGPASLMRGLRSVRDQSRRAAGGRGAPPLFASLRGGLGRLVDRLERELRERGVRFELCTSVPAAPIRGFAATIVTTPAPAAAALVAARCPGAAAELAGVDYASVAVTVLVYPAGALTQRLAGTGFLVPATEGRLVTACSFGSSKWPHWAAPGDVVLRASAGRWGDDRALAMGDDELAARVHAELALALHLTEGPRAVRVARWTGALPQYRPGHHDRLARAEAALARDVPHVHLAGAGYRGVGIAACVAQGRAAARRALAPEGRATG